MIDLSDNVALVTGGAKRLGRATAVALARTGVDVIVHYRHSALEAESLAEEIEAMGRRAWMVKADLRNTDEAAALFARAESAARPVDFVINNASFFPSDTVLDFSMDDLAANVNVHAAAPLLLARALAKTGRPGAIVNFLDARFVDYDREHAAYHLSKRMLATLTRMLAVELAPTIRVNAVAPGLVLPPEGKDQAYLDALAHTNVLKRHGFAEDIAEAVVFLLRSDFVTGQVLFIDGGRHMAGRMYE